MIRTPRPLALRNVAQATAVTFGLALIVAACSGDDESPTPTASAGPTAEAAAEATAAQVALADTEEVTPITFEEFYTRASIREGLKLSDKLTSLDGRKVVMQGYMAPPLKPELDFFVLTKVRLAYCPFCSTAADWPDDIAVVYTPSPMKATERAVSVEGTIEVGSRIDAETGMLSLVRIYADKVDKL